MNFSKDISKFKEECVSSELIYDGKVIRVFRDEITLPDGKPAYREYNRHIGAVCVIPLTDDGEVICVRQYRYPIGDMLLEIPAGKLDFKGEDPDEAVLRELREETGAVAGKMTFLGELDTSPALINEKIYMYMAEELSFVEKELDDDEFLEVEKAPLSELVDMVMQGKISDAKTQIAVLKAARLKGVI